MFYAYITKLVQTKIHPCSVLLDKQRAYEEQKQLVCYLKLVVLACQKYYHPLDL